jgi:hypothetical protein
MRKILYNYKHMEAALSNHEQERLRRLREQQLRLRDPHTKQRNIQQNITRKERRMRKSFSFIKAWGDIPHIIKVPIYMLLVGILTIVILPMLWESRYAVFTSAGIAIVLVIFGLTLGNALDVRDNIKRNIK